MDDSTLNWLLNADAPTPRDPAFVLAVLTRIEQTRFHRAVLRNIGFAIAAGLLLALAAPAFDTVWRDVAAPLSNGFVMAALLLAGSFLAWPWLTQRS